MTNSCCTYLTSAMCSIPKFCVSTYKKLTSQSDKRQILQQKTISHLHVFLRTQIDSPTNFPFQVQVDILGQTLKEHPEFITAILEKYEYNPDLIPASNFKRAIELVRQDIHSLELRFNAIENFYHHEDRSNPSWKERLQKIAKFFPNIQSLTIDSPENLDTAAAWIGNSFNNHKITSIKISRITMPYHFGLNNLSRIFRLTSLTFENCTLSMELMNNFNDPKSLTELTFIDSFSLSYFQILKTLPNVKSIIIRKSPIIIGEFEREISSLKGLKQLILSKTADTVQLARLLKRGRPDLKVVTVEETAKPTKSPLGFLVAGGMVLFICCWDNMRIKPFLNWNRLSEIF
jgi:hypothetical protein